METFSALLAICAGNSPVPGEFPTQRPVTRSFDVFFDLRLNKRSNKQSWGWWFETPSPPFWRHRNVCVNELDHHRIRQWLVACSAPNHYLNQWWHIWNWTLRTFFQWKIIWSSIVFIQENAFENIVGERADILPRFQCVNHIKLQPIGRQWWGAEYKHVSLGVESNFYCSSHNIFSRVDMVSIH